MKKVKEFLLLFVPLIALTVLPIVLFVSNHTSDEFVSNSQYLKLFLNDGLFLNSLLNTYFVPAIISLVVVLIFALLCHFIVFLKKRKIFYPVGGMLSSLVSLGLLIINKTNYFGLPMGVYDPQYLVSNSPQSISISFYDALLAVQIGFLTTLIFWLIELLVIFIKKKKTV